MCFAAAANRLPLSTIGLLQFLTPILQLSCGVFIVHEAVPGTEWIGFAIVWLALALLTYDSLGQIRKRKRRTAQPQPAQTVRELTISQSPSSVSFAELSGSDASRSRASSA
jgi:chloramphenicol-sensitive protein RarD